MRQTWNAGVGRERTRSMRKRLRKSERAQAGDTRGLGAKIVGPDFLELLYLFAEP